MLPLLRAAAGDFSWLLSRGYAEVSALKLVGDRYQLRARQRLAVMRSACSDRSLAVRRRARRQVTARRRTPLWIDGYNVLITVESALAAGFLFCGRDGCLRDLASLHGTYRAVEETDRAVDLLGEFLASRSFAPALWLLDEPVSNSGRLAARIRETARRHAWDWEVRLVRDPDRQLAQADAPVATSDSWILDRCGAWVNLARRVIDEAVEAPRIVWLWGRR